MKKIIKIIIVILLIFLLKVSTTFTINEIMIRKYYNGNFNTSLIKYLYFINITEPYIAYYNHGNLLYQNEQYKKAEEKFQAALKHNPTDSRVCDIQINLTLAKVKQIDINNPEQALKELKKARNILYENHCADAKDDSGKSKEAEELEEEIKEIEKQLGGSDENEEPNEQEEEENEGEKEKEKEIEEKLKENRQDANENRQDNMNNYGEVDYSYHGNVW